MLFRALRRPRAGLLFPFVLFMFAMAGSPGPAPSVLAQQVPPPTPAGMNDLGDFVWDDKHPDGVYDPATEDGIQGATVYLSRVGTLGSWRAPEVTDPTGHFRFRDLACGRYTLRFEPPPDKADWRFTIKGAGYDRSKDSDADEAGITAEIDMCAPTNSQVKDRLDIDAGLVSPEVTGMCAPGSGLTLGDMIWDDKDRDGIQEPGEPGLGNVEVRLYGMAFEDQSIWSLASLPTGLKTWTNTVGRYEFRCLQPGMYYIAIPDIPNYTVSKAPPAPAYLNRNGDQNCSAIPRPSASPRNGISMSLHPGNEAYISGWTTLTEGSRHPIPSDSPNRTLDCGFKCAGEIDVLFVIDRSNSISESALNGAFREAGKVLNEMAFPQQRVGLITFAEHATLVAALQDSDGATRSALRDLDNRSHQGYSNIAEAIRVARDHFAADGRPDAHQLILIWSDGEQIDPEGVPEGDPVAEAVQARAAGIRIAGFWQAPIRDEIPPTQQMIDDAKDAMKAMVSSPGDFHESQYGGVETLTDLACPRYGASANPPLECPNGSSMASNIGTGVRTYFGVVLPGNGLARGTQRDGQWRVRGPGQGAGALAGPAYVLSSPPVEWTQAEGARWIGPSRNGQSPAGTYRYEVTFDLPDRINEIRLRLSLWANGNIDHVEINGRPFEIPAGGPSGGPFGEPVEFGFPDPALYLPGQTNTLTVVVNSPDGNSALQVVGSLEVCAGNQPNPPAPPSGLVPQIDAIRVKGMGAPGDEPTTGMPTEYTAVYQVPAGVTIDDCYYTGDGITEPGGLHGNRWSGQLDPRCLAVRQFSPAPGPRPDSYGPKQVRLHLVYRVQATGFVGTVSRSHDYKLFFRRDESDVGKSQPQTPNWFEYWGDDAAVPGLAASHVEYAPSIEPVRGRYFPDRDMVALSKIALAPQNGFVPAHGNGSEFCNFWTPPTSALSGVASTLRHENEHRAVQHAWSTLWIGPNGPWPDSDRQGDNNDSLPDDYEANDLGSDVNNTDTCGLGQESFPGWADYSKYGDNEVLARRSQQQGGYVPTRDWANPGSLTATGDPAPSGGPVAPSLVAEETAGATGLGARAALTLFDRVFGQLAGRLSPLAAGPIARLASASPATSPAMSPSLTATDVLDSGGAATLAGSYDIALPDADNDGLIDALVVDVAVNSVGGTYVVSATLRAANGTAFFGSGATAPGVPQGTQHVAVRFEGRDIRAAGADGPFTVSRVELFGASDMDVFPMADSADDVVSTAFLAATGFERAAVVVAGGFAESAIDVDGDALIDTLRIAFDLDVADAATYAVALALGPADEPVVVQQSLTLGTGLHTVALDVPGNRLFQRRRSGPFAVLGVAVDAADGERIAHAAPAFQTAAHVSTDFAHDDVWIDASTVASEVIAADGVTGNAFLKAEVGLAHPEQAMGYRYRAELRDDQGAVVAQVAGEVGPAAVETDRLAMNFPGGQIRRSGTDGPYRLSVALFDKAGERIDSVHAVHATDAYTATGFVAPPVSAATVVGDRLEDGDGDGQPDTLVVDVALTAGIDGAIALSGRLGAEPGRVADWSIATVDVVAGQQAVASLRFSTRKLSASGHTGGFDLGGLVAWDASEPAQFTPLAADFATRSVAPLVPPAGPTVP